MRREVTCTCVLIAAAASMAPASVVAESEIDGSAVNNSIASAQFVGGSTFTAAADPSIFGNLPTATILGRGGSGDIDFFGFDAPPGIAYFDIDGGEADTYLALFDSSGTVLAASDDSFPTDAGSSSDLDSFLGTVNLSGAGRYYIAVSAAGNAPNAVFSGPDFFELVRPDGAFGGHGFVGADAGDSGYAMSGLQEGFAYTLHITVPSPSNAAMAGLVAGGLFTRRRR